MALKGFYVRKAYSEMRISGLTVTPSAEDYELALQSQEDMVLDWQDTRNVCLNWAFEDEADPNTESGAPTYANRAIATNLAVEMLAAFNKTVPDSLIRRARGAYCGLSGKALQLREVAYPNRMPLGSGNTSRWNRWWRFYTTDNRTPA